MLLTTSPSRQSEARVSATKRSTHRFHQAQQCKELKQADSAMAYRQIGESGQRLKLPRYLGGFDSLRRK